MKKPEDLAKDISLKGKRAYVVLDDFKETSGKVILSDKHSEHTRIGTIAAVGNEASPEWEVGDTVVISYYTGIKLHLYHYGIYSQDAIDRHRIVDSREILAKLGE